MLTFTTGPDHVLADGARLERQQVAGLLRIWGDERDALLRIGTPQAVEMARKVRSQLLDLDLAQPLAWAEDNRPIAEVRPINVVVRALDPSRWAAVPGEAACLAMAPSRGAA